MSKPIDNYLDSVVETYKDFVKNGEVIPLEFNFPAFKVTKGVFNFYAVDSLSERVRIGVDSGIYDLQKYSDDITYDELVDYSSRKKMGLTTPIEDKTTGVLIEKVLPEKIRKDSSITSTEARMGALSGACVKTMDLKLQELINFEYFKPEPKNSSKELKSESTANDFLLSSKERIDFVATIVAMKEIVPQVHRKIMDSLTDRENLARDSIKAYSNNMSSNNKEIAKQNVQVANLVVGLKDEAANPSVKVLERVLEVDPSLERNLIDKYPKEMKAILTNPKSTYKHSM